MRSVDPSSLKQLAKEAANIALKKIALGAENHPSMKEYVDWLLRRFDANFDGSITLDELSSGLKSLNIHLTPKERINLMKKLDINGDGDITAEELLRSLSAVDVRFTKS